MRTPPVLLASLAGLLLGVTHARAGETEKTFEVRELTDVTYFDGRPADAFRHKLDIFVPKGKQDFPVVVFLHGGAWTIGDKSCIGLYSAVGRFLASRGVGALFPNYRLSPWVKHPEHIKDVARAYAWTHKNIGKYGGDPKKMFIAGHSAGGHLAALLATDEQYLKAEGLSRKDIRGVIALSGVYRIPDKVEFTLAPPEGGLGVSVEMKSNPFDFVFGKDPKEREAASPVCHVCAGLPPILLINAEHDLPLLPQMAQEFARALKAKKCEVEVLKVEDRGHNDLAFRAGKPTTPWPGPCSTLSPGTRGNEPRELPS